MKWTAVLTALLLTEIVAAHAQRQEDKKRPKGATVEIKSMKFEPAEIRIKVGQTVVWTNRDERDHTVTANDAKAFKSGNVKRGGTFEHTFAKRGKYPYSCSYHPRMKGIIIVQ